jgi:hypothetical protein
VAATSLLGQFATYRNLVRRALQSAELDLRAGVDDAVVLMAFAA